MSMKALHKKRLLKLAAHLRSGKLGHEEFAFNKINADKYGRELTHNGCGTMGCAIGECPVAFPRSWKWQNGITQLKTSNTGDICSGFRDGESFFHLESDELCHLFVPNEQNTILYGGRALDHNATAKQVAANIEAFVKRKEKESK